MALLATTVLLLELYRSREAVGLRSELDALRREVENLLKWDQLKAFQAAAYAEEEASEDNDDDDDDDNGDVNDVDDDYDLDYDVDEDVTSHEKKQLLHSIDYHKKHMVDIAQEPVERTKREIGGSVPVMSERYGADRKHHNSTTEGLRLYESLVTRGGKNKPKDLSLDWSSTENPIKSYHRVSPLWTSKSHHKKYVGAPAELSEAPATYRRQRHKRRA